MTIGERLPETSAPPTAQTTQKEWRVWRDDRDVRPTDRPMDQLDHGSHTDTPVTTTTTTTVAAPPASCYTGDVAAVAPLQCECLPPALGALRALPAAAACVCFCVAVGVCLVLLLALSAARLRAALRGAAGSSGAPAAAAAAARRTTVPPPPVRRVRAAARRLPAPAPAPAPASDHTASSWPSAAECVAAARAACADVLAEAAQPEVATSPAAAPAAGGGWRFCTTQQGVRICAQKFALDAGGSDGEPAGAAVVLGMRGQAEVDVSAAAFAEVASDPARRPQWDRLVTENRVLADAVNDVVDDDDDNDDNDDDAAAAAAKTTTTTKIIYTAFRGVWPVVAPRETVTASLVETPRAGGATVLASVSVEHAAAATVAADRVRAHVHAAGFVVEPIGDERRCRVTFVAKIDLGGRIPRALATLLAQRQPLCVRRIADIAAAAAARPAAAPPAAAPAAHTRLHPLLAQNEIFVSAGVWDVLSARLAERAGFSSVVVSGFCLAASHLGEPDFGLLTQTEVLDVARRICASGLSIPVVVDGDTGYGSALNVQRMVRECVAMGARGIILEDQTWPKRCGHMRGKSVIDAAEHVQKIRAAADARGADAEETFVITARTDARVVSIDEAIRRARLYRAAGADFVFVEAPESAEEIRTIAHELAGTPLVLNMIDGGRTPMLSLDECHRLGFLSVGYVLTGLFASARAVQGAFAHVVEHGSSAGIQDRLMGFDEFTALVGLPERVATDEKYKA